MDLTTALPYINTALLLIGGLGFGEYLKKRAESLATRKDIEDLTRKVEVIKAEISDAMWNRQKRWELKREVLFEVVKRVAEVDQALGRLNAAVHVEQESGAAVAPFLLEAITAMNQASADLNAAAQLVATVCGDETYTALRKLKDTESIISLGLMERKDATIYKSSQHEFKARLEAVRAAIRKELGIDNAP
jgi:hypothetical protein